MRNHRKNQAFTLVELLAVIAILAIILLIAVPMILGVIEDAKQESFRNSVRSTFHAIELYNARTGNISGNISDLDMNGETLTGSWSITDGKVTLANVSNGTYCVATLGDQGKGSKFSLTKDCSATPPVEETIAAPGVAGGSTTWITTKRGSISFDDTPLEGKTFTLTPPTGSTGIKEYEYFITNSNTVPTANQTATGTTTETSIEIRETGTYIFFRAVNNSNQKGAWTTAQNLYIDSEEPTINIGPLTSGQTYNIADICRATYGISGGTVSGSIDGETLTDGYTFQKEVGTTYTVNCSATSGAGMTATSFMTMSSQKPSS